MLKFLIFVLFSCPEPNLQAMTGLYAAAKEPLNMELAQAGPLQLHALNHMPQSAGDKSGWILILFQDVLYFSVLGCLFRDANHWASGFRGI